MKKQKSKRVKTRHKIIYFILANIMKVTIRFKYGFKTLNRFKIKRNEPVLIVSNHQTDLDPIWVALSFNRNLYFVCTDTLTSSTLYPLMKFSLNPIPKKKGASDMQTMRGIIETVRDGGSICLFPEGNRTYAEFQFTVDEALAKLIRKLRIPLVIFNINGGYGKNPRFSKSIRKGRMTGSVKRVIYPEEYDKYTNEEFMKIIMEGLRVYDSESGELFKSNERAEYLERELFVCPKCGRVETLVSKGNTLKCTNCGLEVEYMENLTFQSTDPDFKFKKMIDWYNFQLDWVRMFEPDGDSLIFKDEYAKLYTSNLNEKRKLVSEGEVSLDRNNFKVGDISFDVKDIEIASPISGKNLGVTINGKSYLIKGHDRFNPLKYVLMFNRLDTKMKEKETDIYFRIDERK